MPRRHVRREALNIPRTLPPLVLRLAAGLPPATRRPPTDRGHDPGVFDRIVAPFDVVSARGRVRRASTDAPTMAEPATLSSSSTVWPRVTPERSTRDLATISTPRSTGRAASWNVCAATTRRAIRRRTSKRCSWWEGRRDDVVALQQGRCQHGMFLQQPQYLVRVPATRCAGVPAC